MEWGVVGRWVERATILRLGDPGPGADDRARACANSRAAAAADGRAESRAEPGPDERAAGRLRVRLVAHRRDRLVGVLAARHVIVISAVVLRRGADARRNECGSGAEKYFADPSHLISPSPNPQP